MQLKSIILGLILISAISSSSAAGKSADISIDPQSLGLYCSPKHLSSNDILTLRMIIPHGGELGIIDPSGEFYMVSFFPWLTSAQKPLQVFDDLASLREVKVRVSDLIGDHGRGVGPVFQKSGWYTIKLSDNLETDDETPIPERKVYYVGKSSK